MVDNLLTQTNRVQHRLVPESLLPEKLEFQDGRPVVHMYTIRAECAQSEVHECSYCWRRLDALSGFGIALPTLLPEDLMSQPLELFLPKEPRELVRLTLCHLYSGPVSEADLANMQRFHKSLLCWESPRETIDDDGDCCRSSQDSAVAGEPLCAPLGPKRVSRAFKRETWLLPGTVLPAAREHDSLGWSAHSHGSWYTIFPSPTLGHGDACPGAFGTDSFSAFLKTSADEAAVLAHNLRMQAVMCRAASEELQAERSEAAVAAQVDQTAKGTGMEAELENERRQLQKQQRFLEKQPLRAQLRILPPLPRRALFGQIVSVGPISLFAIASAERQMPPNFVSQPLALSTVLKLVSPAEYFQLSGGDGTIPWKQCRAVRAKLWNSVSHRFIRCVVPSSRHQLAPASKQQQQSSVDTTAPLEEPTLPWTIRDQLVIPGSADKSLVDELVAKGDPDDQLALLGFYGVNKLTLVQLLSQEGECDGEAEGEAEGEGEGEGNGAEGVGCAANVLHGHPPSSSSAQHAMHNTPHLFLHHALRPLGKQLWQYVGVVAPSVLWRLQSLLLAAECRAAVVDLVRAEAHLRMLHGHGHVVACAAAAPPTSHRHRLSHQALLETRNPRDPLRRGLPPLSDMLAAITSSAANECINCERIEMLGDAVLKLVVSQHVYQGLPGDSEGRLTESRMKTVSNAYLARVCEETGLALYVRAVQLSVGKQHLAFCPSGFSPTAQNSGMCLWNANLSLNTRPGRQEPAEQRHPTTKRPLGVIRATVRRKSLADMIEALLGAFFLAGGLDAAQAVARAFRTMQEPPLLVAPPSIELGLGIQSLTLSMCESSGKAAVEDASRAATLDQQWLQGVQNLCGHRFRSPSFLRRALTLVPKSKSNSAAASPSQRLEFLGDAVLEAVCITELFNKLPMADQGELSARKQALLCNAELAKIGMALGLQRFLLDENRNQKPEPSTKNVADSLEALFGAIFLDCGGGSRGLLTCTSVASVMGVLRVDDLEYRAGQLYNRANDQQVLL